MKASALVTLAFFLLYKEPGTAADLVDTAAAEPSFRVFVAALEKAGFAQTLKSDGPFTIFIPTDSAFEALPANTWARLVEDPVRLSQVLSYHVIPGRHGLDQLPSGKLKTTEGQSLLVEKYDGRLTVNGANVRRDERHADNGMILTIDRVLMPSE